MLELLRGGIRSRVRQLALYVTVASSCRDLCWDWRQVIFCPVFSNAKVPCSKMVTPALNSFPDGQFLCAVLSVKYSSQAREAAV